MRRSIRCVHGMCLATVGCQVCGVPTPPDHVSQHLRRANERRVRNKAHVPTGYDNADGKRAHEGNTNRGFKY